LPEGVQRMSADVVTLGTQVVPLIEQVATTSPENVAVRGPDATLTYAELVEHAEHIARRLRLLGVNRGDLVGLCLERSASLVVGALAILMADGAYVAIDPKYPDERIRWMLEDSGAIAVVCDATTFGRIGATDRSVVMLGDGGVLGSGSTLSGEPTARRAQSSDLAYVVYTSGSTGQPKGVLVEHASLTNLVEWHRKAFSLDANDRCTQIASPGFDAAVWEIWP